MQHHVSQESGAVLPPRATCSVPLTFVHPLLDSVNMGYLCKLGTVLSVGLSRMNKNNINSCPSGTRSVVMVVN